ncbi:hypothetical protein GCM10009531_49930 [Actinoplanes capillaceus]
MSATWARKTAKGSQRGAQQTGERHTSAEDDVKEPTRHTATDEDHASAKDGQRGPTRHTGEGRVSGGDGEKEGAGAGANGGEGRGGGERVSGQLSPAGAARAGVGTGSRELVGRS